MLSSTLIPLLLTNTALADEYAPKPTPYLLVQSYVTVYDQDEDSLADPAGYGDPEDDVGLKSAELELVLLVNLKW